MEQHTPGNTSVLARLRSIMPSHGLDERAARIIAQRQAQMLLLMLGGALATPIPVQVLERVPCIELDLVADLPVAGASYWTGRNWRLEANSHEPSVRQRFTLAHEFKHIIDHPGRDLYYASHAVRERVADYFAACLLMPRHLIVAAWCSPSRPDPQAMADRFSVSVLAMQRRLRWLRLIADDGREIGQGMRPNALPSQAPLAIAGDRSIGDQP